MGNTSAPYIGPSRQLPPHLPARAARPTLRILVGLLLVTAAAAGGSAFLRRGDVPRRVDQASPPAIVSFATARRGDIDVYEQAIGTVTPLQTAAIASQVTGVVTDIRYGEGQSVEKGDPLVEIDSRPYRATLAQAEATLERDEHLLAQARMDLARYKQAWERNAIAKQTLDDQEKLVLQNEAVVKNDRGVVDYDRLQVEYCRLKAPIAGRLGLRLLDRGNLVLAAGGTTLVVITQVKPITVVFAVPADHLPPIRARLHDGANLRVDALDRLGQKQLATGTLLALDNQVDTTTGTVKARAQFDNSDDALFPNDFVNARVLVDTLRGATLVPSAAVQQNGTTSFVYLIESGVAHVRRVEPGVTEHGVTAVQGIGPGDVVANSGFERLREGARVASSNTPPPAGSRGSTEP